MPKRTDRIRRLLYTTALEETLQHAQVPPQTEEALTRVAEKEEDEIGLLARSAGTEQTANDSDGDEEHPLFIQYQPTMAGKENEEPQDDIR